MRLTLLLCLASITLFSQYNSEFLNFEKTGRSISINGEYELGSNGIYNSLLNKFIFGGYIDKNTKDASDNSMKNLNELYGGIELFVVWIQFVKADRVISSTQKIINPSVTKKVEEFFERESMICLSIDIMNIFGFSITTSD